MGKDTKLQPDFSDDRLFKLADHSNASDKKVIDFPTHVFPELVQRYINELYRCNSFPKAYTGAAVLAAVATGIGGAYKVRNYDGNTQGVTLPIILCGNSGSKKSPVMNEVFAAIIERNKRMFVDYLSKQKEYEQQKKKEKPGEQNTESTIEPPVYKTLIVTDYTQEVFIEILDGNSRGVCLFFHEVAQWFKNFNKYNSGSEQEFWMAIFDGAPYSKARKSARPVYIDSPAVTLIGAMQDAVLNKLAQDDRADNGFVYRLLFARLENVKKAHLTGLVAQPEILHQWRNVVNRLLDLEMSFDSFGNATAAVIPVGAPAQKLWMQWYAANTDEFNELTDSGLESIYSKMETYVLRFALNLQLLNYVCGCGSNTEIELPAMQGAIELRNYFAGTAIDVYNIISKKDPLVALNRVEKSVFTALPGTFQTGEGVNIAKAFGMKERTFKNFLKNKDLFNWLKQGVYEKAA